MCHFKTHALYTVVACLCTVVACLCCIEPHNSPPFLPCTNCPPTSVPPGRPSPPCCRWLLLPQQGCGSPCWCCCPTHDHPCRSRHRRRQQRLSTGDTDKPRHSVQAQLWPCQPGQCVCQFVEHFWDNSTALSASAFHPPVQEKCPPTTGKAPYSNSARVCMWVAPTKDSPPSGINMTIITSCLPPPTTPHHPAPLPTCLTPQSPRPLLMRVCPPAPRTSSPPCQTARSAHMHCHQGAAGRTSRGGGGGRTVKAQMMRDI